MLLKLSHARSDLGGVGGAHPNQLPAGALWLDQDPSRANISLLYELHPLLPAFSPNLPFMTRIHSVSPISLDTNYHITTLIAEGTQLPEKCKNSPLPCRRPSMEETLAIRGDQH